MTLTAAFLILTIAMTLIAFLAAKRVRGPWPALAASGLMLAGMAALFVGMVVFITRTMP